jgi:radical SAM protein with 4Fe4S-binding SPASM domain
MQDQKVIGELIQKGFIQPFSTAISHSVKQNKNKHILVFVITKRCNLKCSYCFANSSPKHREKMEPKTAVSIFKKMSQIHDISMVHFIGGEPTLNFTVIRKVKEIADKLNIFPKFYITTNGTSSVYILDWLVDNRFTLKVSWDGLMAQKIARPLIGGQDSGPKVERTIEHLVNRGARFCIRITATKSNLSNLVESIQWLAEHGVKYIHIEPMSPDGRGADVQGDVPEPAEFESQFSRIIALAEEKKFWVMNSALGNLFSPSDYFCCSPRDRVHHFNPDGSISACYKVDDKTNSLANYFIKGNYEIIENRCEIQWKEKTISRLLRLDSSYYASCRSCFLRYVCSGGCPHCNLGGVRSGEIDPRMCEIRRRILRKAILHLYERAKKGERSCLEGIEKFYHEDSLESNNSCNGALHTKKI